MFSTRRPAKRAPIVCRKTRRGKSMKGRLSVAVAVAVFIALFVGSAHAEAKMETGKKGYVGSQTCEKCHKIQYESWKETYHSKMVRKPAEGILKAVVEKWATDGATPGPATGNVTGKPFKMEDVVYVIGSNWKQRFLVKDDTTGGYQFLDKQFNRMSGTWEKYGNKNDCLAVVGIVQAFAHVPQADSTVFPNNNRK
jgi:hypothetical protein